MHYYQFNIGDYVSHTRHLSAIEDIAYRRLLDAYYLSERPLNSCSTSVARQIGMREYETEVHVVLNEFFLLTEHGWENHRADKEIQHYKSKIEQASRAGKASVERKRNARSTTDEQPSNKTATEVQPTNNQEPRTNNHKPIKNTVAKPDGLTLEVWNDFLELRKKQRKPLTQTALKLILHEAQKAGWTIERALSECCTRGWQSFKAEWVQDKTLSKTGQTNQTVMSGLTRGLVGGGSNVKLLSR